MNLVKLLSLVVLMFVGSQFTAAGKLNVPYGSDHKFSFVVLSDIHVSDNDSKLKKLEKFVSFYNTNLAAHSEFVLTTGDNVSFLLTDRTNGVDEPGNNKLRSFVQVMSGLEDPFYLDMGNHEYKIDERRDADGPFTKSEILKAEKIWKKETGSKPYYSFEKGEYTLVFLNNMRGRYLDRFFDEKQINWLENKLKKSSKVLLFLHHPFETDLIPYWYKKEHGTITKEDEPEFFELLSRYRNKIIGVFTGHGHEWIHDTLLNTINIWQTASFGDNNEFAYYVVTVSPLGIQVKKSIQAPWFEGFNPIIDKQNEHN